MYALDATAHTAASALTFGSHSTWDLRVQDEYLREGRRLASERAVEGNWPRTQTVFF